MFCVFRVPLVRRMSILHTRSTCPHPTISQPTPVADHLTLVHSRLLVHSLRVYACELLSIPPSILDRAIPLPQSVSPTVHHLFLPRIHFQHIILFTAYLIHSPSVRAAMHPAVRTSVHKTYLAWTQTRIPTSQHTYVRDGWHSAHLGSHIDAFWDGHQLDGLRHRHFVFV